MQITGRTALAVRIKWRKMGWCRCQNICAPHARVARFENGVAYFSRWRAARGRAPVPPDALSLISEVCPKTQASDWERRRLITACSRQISAIALGSLSPLCRIRPLILGPLFSILLPRHDAQLPGFPIKEAMIL